MSQAVNENPTIEEQTWHYRKDAPNTTDIVATLRERAASYDASGPSAAHTADLLRQAADEIERIRDNVRADAEHLLEQINDANVVAERERCAKIADLYVSQARPLGDEAVGDCPLTAYFEGQKIVAQNIGHDIRKGL